MRASLDTNVLIHVYRAGLEDILFDFFADGVFIYEQIRKIELEHHGQDILDKVDADIESGKIEVYTNESLKQQAVLKIFETNVNENKLLYGSGNLGEVYAISLAQTIGAYSLVTDDIKQGGPYMSLLQMEYDIMLFTFADILILRYLMEDADAVQTMRDFNTVNEASDLQWSFRSQMVKFIKRFWKDPYKNEERTWMSKLVEERKIRVKSKFTELQKLL